MLIGQGLFGGYPGFSTPGVGIARSNLMELMAKGERAIPTTPEEVLQGSVIEEYLETDQRGLLYKARSGRAALRRAGTATAMCSKESRRR